MSKLIKGCEIVDNEWTLVEQDSELPLQAIAAGELVILPARLWLTNQDALRGKANVGLWLDSHEEPATAFTSAAVLVPLSSCVCSLLLSTPLSLAK